LFFKKYFAVRFARRSCFIGPLTFTLQYIIASVQLNPILVVFVLFSVLTNFSCF